MSRCPDVGVLRRLLDGDLSADEAAAADTHVEGCADCQRVLDALVADSRLRGDRRGSTLGQPALLQIPGDRAEPPAGTVETEVVTDSSLTGAYSSSSGPAPVAAPGPAGRLGDCELLRIIGRGGMGVVYEALQGSLRRRVAVKLLPEHGDVGRFRREAQAAGRLHHTNIVPVFGVGEHEGQPYYVMQYIAGRGLDAVLHERAAAAGGDGERVGLDDREAARVGLQVAEALAYAHANGVIHRDIKPSNLLLDERRTVWVTDFGLAHDAGDSAVLTGTGDVLGTLRYLAPERLTGRGDARADIYGLGVTLYELACGRPAYEPTDRSMLIHRLMHQDPPRPRLVRPAMARDLETIILKAIARDPDHRYATAGALAEDLRRFLEDRSILARRATPWERAARWCRRNKVVAALGALLAASMVAGTAFSTTFAFRARDESVRARKAAGEATREAGRANENASLAIRQRDWSERLRYISEANLARQEWDGGNVDAARSRLADLVPRQPGDPDLRGWEWFYLDRAFHAELRVLDGPPDGSTAMALAPDGRTLALAAFDKQGGGPIWIVDPISGRTLKIYRGHQRGIINTMAFAADGRTLISAGMNQSVRIWDPVTCQEKAILPGGQSSLVALASDGRLLASKDDGGAVRIWDLASRREIGVLPGHHGKIFSLAFSPDGRRLAFAAEDQTVRIWDIAPRKESAVFRQFDNSWSLAFSPDGRVLAGGGSDGSIRLWDTSTLPETSVLRGHGHGQSVTSLAFASDGRRLASASLDGTVRIWDTTSGSEVAVLRGQNQYVTAVAYVPDGSRLFSAGPDKVRVWDAASDGEGRPLRKIATGCKVQTFAPDGRTLVLVDRDGALRLLDVATGRETGVFRVRRSRFVSAWLAPDGRLLAAGSGFDGTTRIWDVMARRATLTLSGPCRSVRSTPDGHRLVGDCPDGMLRLFDADSGTELATFAGDEDGGLESRHCISPDGRQLAAATGLSTEGMVRVWNTSSHQ